MAAVTRAAVVIFLLWRLSGSCHALTGFPYAFNRQAGCFHGRNATLTSSVQLSQPPRAELPDFSVNTQTVLSFLFVSLQDENIMNSMQLFENVI